MKTKKQKKIQSKNGITLIALIITIILLLILAGVTIAQLSENGVFGKARKAKDLSEYKAAKEMVDLKLIEVKMDCIGNDKEYTIAEIAKNIKNDLKIEIELYYNSTTSSIKNGVTENLVDLTGIVVSVDDYSRFKFLIGSTGNIEGVTTEEITNTTAKTDFRTPEEFEETIGTVIHTPKLNGSIMFEKTTVTSSETINATITMQSNVAEITATDCKWVITNSAAQVGDNVESYTGGNLTSEGKIETIYSTDGDWYIHVLIIDDDGNKKEIVSEKITVDSTTYSYTTSNMVEYDAGNWTQSQINTLNTNKLYDININKLVGNGTFKLNNSSGKNFTFGGFTYKGDTTNAASISNGAIITSRNKSVAPESGYGFPSSDGWIVFEWDTDNTNNTATKKHVKSLVHAGSPENFVYYKTTNDDGYRAEYILSGGARRTGYNKLSDGTTTINTRDWQEYIDTNQSDLIADKIGGGKDIHVMTYAEESRVGDALYPVIMGGFYWLASYQAGGDIWRCGGTNYNTGGAWDHCFGVRPVVTLKSGVYITIDDNHDGSGNKKFVLQMD